MLKLPYDYIRGLVEGEGTFTFDTRTQKMADGKIKRVKIPAFALKMHERDEELLKAVRNTLELTNSVYKYDSHTKTRPNCGKQVMLIVRECISLKDVIIPFFYNKLHGNKSKQFRTWLEKMGDFDTNKYSKYLHKLYKSGYYDKSWNKNFD